MNNDIVVTYDSKTRRLIVSTPFHLGDAMRGFPSRRFDPRIKAWRLPLVKSNIIHLKKAEEIYAFKYHPEAVDAIANYAKIMAAPKTVPFPVNAYDFTRSAAGFLPMEHQIRMLGLSWKKPASAWFAKMGTGKTFTAIHLAMAYWMAGEIDAVVIICPSTLRRTWAKEFAKYATEPYDFYIHETNAKPYQRFCELRPTDTLQALAVSVEGLGISTKSYDSVCAFYGSGRRIFTICDESSRIKNPDARRTQRTIQLGSASKYRLILNGTPIALGIQDLWSQYEFLDPNIIGMGDYWAFKTQYIVMGGYENKQIVGVKNVEELMNNIIPYTCEVGKEVLNLPPKIPMERIVTITAEQRRLLRIVVRGADADPNAPHIKVDNVLEKILRCRQIIGGWLPKSTITWKEIDGVPVEETHTELIPLAENPKLESLLEIIEDNYAGSKFIIWSNFVHEIEAIQNALREKYGEHSVECYYGSTEMGRRSEIEDRYCNDSTLHFFVGNPTAAGLGLTLISGQNDVMVYYSGTNAFIDRAQSEDRAHRIGQKNSVAVVDIIAEGTVDEIIVASIREKTDVETYVYSRIKAGIKLDDMLMGAGA